MNAGLGRIFLYFLVVTLPVWIVTFLGMQGDGLLRDIGRNLGLIGFMILAMQFILAARIKWIEMAFGFDILIRFHKYIALGALCLLILHPVLLAVDGMGWRLLIGLDLPWYVMAGKAALFLVTASVLFSFFQPRLGVKFEKWRLMHDISALAILALIFIHPWYTGSDMHIPALRALWVGVLLLAAATFVYHRFIRPRNLQKRPYLVREVVREAEDVWTVKLVPPKGEVIADYLPGQFHFLTFFRDPALPVEEHHWTISSSPAQKEYLSSTIKAVGDFTATIGQTKPGDTAAVHGSFGRFSYVLHPGDRDLVFLAGGIGITPLMAMLRHMRDTNDSRSVVLLYANKNAERIIFREELASIASGERPRLSVVHVLSKPGSDWTGETGHVDRGKIEKYCGQNLQGKAFYVCGPFQMSETIIATLRKMGVQGKMIRHEIFTFLD
ncbi:Predicted ferric reductase [Desulfonatronum thiosulfatophilum]|uniref:Predicted ferric reductase n=1 Tax=Desulfonatronum thiosulfatophilum TaxID=617002 RepID=A0A1G6D3S1_9BACT|nr:ferric reductase-like transmembrane domain-containing protein [Desulfonatronum thiosulfatophilum]SDB39740.1 Predicted ferric reductase [Desulfonatronum thiosulfatophilum]